METIRLFENKDQLILMELIKVMIGDENPQTVSRDVVTDFYKNPNYHVFVLEIETIVKGFGVLKFNSFEGANRVCEIVWLGIDSDYKKRGYGRKLVKFMEDYAKNKNIRKIYVKTSVRNKVATCFWIKLNYEFEARLLDFSLTSFDDYYFGKNL